MLKQAIQYFCLNQKGENLDKFICEQHILDDGEYIVVEEIEDSFRISERSIIKKDDKTKTIDETGVKNFKFIQKADYLSKYLNSNKAISDKNIHSNNYMTFFVIKENIHSKINNKIIQKYYDLLRNPLSRPKYKEKNTQSIYKEVESICGKPDKEKIDKIEKWICNNIYDLVPKDSKEKTYLKIFFKYDLSEYEKESKRYLIPNIYNKNKFNTNINGITYGASDDNVDLNPNKIYLKNKTRKTKVPFLISLDEVLLQKKFFDFLINMANAGKVNIYLNQKKIRAFSDEESLDNDFNGIYIRVKKGKKGAEILEFDIINDYKVKLKRPIKLKNVLNINYQNIKSDRTYDYINKLKTIKGLINEVLFSKFLNSNYFKETKDIHIDNNNLKMNLLLSRNVLFNWFFKGNSQGVWEVLNKSSLSLIKGSINNGYMLRAAEQFNLRCALKEYFKGGEEMADVLKEVKDSLRKKINIKSTDGTASIENDAEYYFAVGQLASYFISLNKSKNKTHSLANPIINAKNDDRIKQELKKLYKKYNYTIEFTRSRFENLNAMVSSYKPEGKVDDDLIIAGYLHSNLIFEKLHKEEN